MLGVALLLARADPSARLIAIDARIGAERARLVTVEAPSVRLVAAIERLKRAPGVDDRERRIARLGAWLVAMTPPVARQAEALRHDIDLLAAERAGLVLRAALRRAGGLPATRVTTAQITPCASSPFQSPVEGRIVPPRVAAALGHGRGLMLVALPGAPVVAPAAGRIAYAGPFRRYGDIVILDHGHGWTSLLTGLDRLDTRTDRRVAAGETLGAVSAASPRVTIELSRHGRPVDALAMMRRCAAGDPPQGRSLRAPERLEGDT